MYMLVFVAPTVAYADLHFLALGDWGGLPIFPWSTPAQRRVGRAMGALAERQSSSFVLSLGDHFYWHGVKSATDKRWQRTFKNVYRHPSLQHPGFWRAIAGNHDHSGNVSAQMAFAALPNSPWYYPDHQYTWRETLEDERGTTVDFVMLDTQLLCGMPRRRPDRAAPKHWQWAEKQLLDSDADFLVVGGHYPVHSPSGHGPTRCLVKRLEPLLRKCRASVYFSGHDHALFHVGSSDPTAPQYHGVGAGMATSRSKRHIRTVPAGELQFFRTGVRLPLRGITKGGFAGVSVSADALTTTLYDEGGSVLHQHAVPPRTQKLRHAASSAVGAEAGSQVVAEGEEAPGITAIVGPHG